jgi:AbrB family looped-hinge helix DNA binding protein
LVRARLTSKGQLTVPIEIRRRYGLDTGDEVEFVAEQKGAYLVPIKRKGLMDLYGVLRATRPWPGMERARAIAGKKRGAELEKRLRRT